MSTKSKTDVQDESNFSPGEINQMEGKRFKELKKKRVLFQARDVVHIQNF